MERPEIKNFFSKEYTPKEINEIFLSNRELYLYIQNLDLYIDELESNQVQAGVMPNEVVAGGLTDQTLKDVKSLRDQAKSYHQTGYELSCRWIENLMERILEESQREA